MASTITIMDIMGYARQLYGTEYDALTIYGIAGGIYLIITGIATLLLRELVKKTYTIYLVKPTEEQMNQFMSLFIREKFWLESERVKTTRLWCYKVNVSDLEEVKPGLYMTKATFTCGLEGQCRLGQGVCIGRCRGVSKCHRSNYGR